MIQTSNLSFGYNTNTNFKFPDIKLNKQEALLITGGSGKGKTTLLYLLGGLIKPTGGNVTINDTDISGLTEKKLDQFRGRHIGMVLQQSYFTKALTVLENIELAAWLSTGKRATTESLKLLEGLGLADQANKLTQQLSIGQQQRVSIARALVNTPQLLLSDEPTSSLDDENAFLVAELLDNLSKSYGASLVIVTHDQRLKNRFTNQIELS